MGASATTSIKPLELRIKLISTPADAPISKLDVIVTFPLEVDSHWSRLVLVSDGRASTSTPPPCAVERIYPQRAQKPKSTSGFFASCLPADVL